ncbi:MAG: hypothetical protein AVDCRST_MAG64-3337, partial [uncultured Phycisphaerae bacterium]
AHDPPPEPFVAPLGAGRRGGGAGGRPARAPGPRPVPGEQRRGPGRQQPGRQRRPGRRAGRRAGRPRRHPEPDRLRQRHRQPRVQRPDRGPRRPRVPRPDRHHGQRPVHPRLHRRVRPRPARPVVPGPPVLRRVPRRRPAAGVHPAHPHLRRQHVPVGGLREPVLRGQPGRAQHRRGADPAARHDQFDPGQPAGRPADARHPRRPQHVPADVAARRHPAGPVRRAGQRRRRLLPAPRGPDGARGRRRPVPLRQPVGRPDSERADRRPERPARRRAVAERRLAAGPIAQPGPPAADRPPARRAARVAGQLGPRRGADPAEPGDGRSADRRVDRHRPVAPPPARHPVGADGAVQRAGAAVPAVPREPPAYRPAGSAAAPRDAAGEPEPGQPARPQADRPTAANARVAGSPGVAGQPGRCGWCIGYRWRGWCRAGARRAAAGRAGCRPAGPAGDQEPRDRREGPDPRPGVVQGRGTDAAGQVRRRPRAVQPRRAGGPEQPADHARPGERRTGRGELPLGRAEPPAGARRRDGPAARQVRPAGDGRGRPADRRHQGPEGPGDERAQGNDGPVAVGVPRLQHRQRGRGRQLPRPGRATGRGGGPARQADAPVLEPADPEPQQV